MPAPVITYDNEAAAASYRSQKAQERFYRDGGVLRGALEKKRAIGELHEEGTYVHLEYPKMLHLSLGDRSFDQVTETIKGDTLRTTEVREAFCRPVVQDEDQELAVLKAFDRAEALGITVAEDWTSQTLLYQVGLAEQHAAPKAAKVPTFPFASPIVAASAAVASEPDDQALEIAALRAELAALKMAKSRPRRAHRRTQPSEAPSTSVAATPSPAAEAA